MKITNKQLAQALFESTESLSGSKLDNALQNFVVLLAKSQKLKQVDNIMIEFEKIIKKSEGIMQIEVKSARKLDKETLENIKKVFGKKVEATETIDESLMGGIAVKTDDKILDGSLKTQINNLSLKLTS